MFIVGRRVLGGLDSRQGAQQHPDKHLSAEEVEGPGCA
jgi:hypothetical protein